MIACVLALLTTQAPGQTVSRGCTRLCGWLLVADHRFEEGGVTGGRASLGLWGPVLVSVAQSPHFTASAGPAIQEPKYANFPSCPDT